MPANKLEEAGLDTSEIKFHIITVGDTDSGGASQNIYLRLFTLELGRRRHAC